MKRKSDCAGASKSSHRTDPIAAVIGKLEPAFKDRFRRGTLHIKQEAPADSPGE